MSKGFACASAVMLTVAAAAAAGCAKFEPRPLEPGLAAASLKARSLADPSLRAFVTANLDTDTGSFAAWDLDRLTLAAYYFQPALDLARAERAVAEAGRITAGERPVASIGITPGSNTTTSMPSPRIVTLTADLGLETANKRSYREAQAAQLAEAARLNIASVAWQVRSRVRQSLLALYGASEAQVLLQRQLAIHEANLRILEGQYQAGAISAFERTQARVAADSARLALRDAESREAEARAQLAEAIGVPVLGLAGAVFSYDLFGAIPAEPATVPAREQALLGRADVLQALAE